MALLLTSVFGVTGCGSDDDEAPVESRIKNFVFTNENHGGVKVSGAIKSTAGNDFGNIRGQIDVSKSGARGMSPSMARDSNLRRDRGSMSFLDDDMDD